MFKKPFKTAFVKSDPEVWIDVRGGVAELIRKPKGIIVIIKDWDNTPATEEVYTAQDEVEG